MKWLQFASVALRSCPGRRCNWGRTGWSCSNSCSSKAHRRMASSCVWRRGKIQINNVRFHLTQHLLHMYIYSQKEAQYCGQAISAARGMVLHTHPYTCIALGTNHTLPVVHDGRIHHSHIGSHLGLWCRRHHRIMGRFAGRCTGESSRPAIGWCGLRRVCRWLGWKFTILHVEQLDTRF